MRTLNILKIGGNVLADDEMLSRTLDLFAAYESPAILVHGGGRKASELLEQLGHIPKMINGRRITDEATLEVVTMVYAGLLNKQLVAKLQARGCNALGVSGADGNLIQAHKRVVRDVDYGFAGDIDAINADGFQVLIDGGFSPVCCAITHDCKGQILNTNADTIAAEIAIALASIYKVSLHYCFEKPGVLIDAEKEDSIIPVINTAKYAELRAAGIVHSGMLPKLDNAFNALGKGVQTIRLGNLDTLLSNKATNLIL